MDIIIEWIVRLMVWLSSPRFIGTSGFGALLSRLGIVRYEKWQLGQKLKLLLVGYNGARNTGADARVVALVQQLTEEFGDEQIELTVMTLNADNWASRFTMPMGRPKRHSSQSTGWGKIRFRASALLCPIPLSPGPMMAN